MGTPDPEVEIDEALIGRLIASQISELSPETVEIVAHGWDNVTARVGDRHAARLPRRSLAVELIRNEQRWLPTIATMVDVSIPVPTHNGSAGDGYPWPWSMVPWIEGATAEQSPLDASSASRFGAFLADLHRPSPPDAPVNPFRGSPLGDHDSGVQRRWKSFRKDRPEVAELCEPALAIWDSGVAADVATDTHWGHGDLHPRNVLTSNGSLTGVIDWGDLNGGDRSTDLASVWMQFGPDDHDAVWSSYGSVDVATRTRARAWAIGFAGMLISTGFDDDEGFLALGTGIAKRAIATD